MIEIHETDKEYLRLIREHINKLLSRAAEKYGEVGNVLEIGPGGYSAARELYGQGVFYTADINKNSDPDIVIDICQRVGPAEYWNVILCTDVLEHVKSPFDAIKNIHYSLGKGGILILSTPLNFRIHGMGDYSPNQGPPPDYWRFTESGLRLLLKDFDILEIDALESDRPLFPIHYTVIAKKKDG